MTRKSRFNQSKTGKSLRPFDKCDEMLTFSFCAGQWRRAELAIAYPALGSYWRLCCALRIIDTLYGLFLKIIIFEPIAAQEISALQSFDDILKQTASWQAKNGLSSLSLIYNFPPTLWKWHLPFCNSKIF